MPERVTSAELGYLLDQPPEAAIRFFERKGYAISWNWHDTLAEAHARAFTVARVTRTDLLADIHGAVAQALREGKTERWFQQTLTPVLQERGWWGKEEIEVKPGETREVQLGSPRRLGLIYRQNVQSALLAGRYDDFIRRSDTHPYWQYIAVLDARTRPTHRAFSGRIYRWNDPIWNTHWPPLGFNCRCRVRAYTEAQIQRRGLAVDSSAGRLSERTQQAGVDYLSGEVITQRQTGIRITGPDGKPTRLFPDAGFGANPIHASYSPELDRYPTDIARQYVRGVVTGPAFERWIQGWTGYVDRIKASGPAALAADILTRTARDRGLSVALEAQGLKLPVLPAEPAFPVAVLSPRAKQALQAESQEVRFSRASLIEHLDRHPEIGLTEYQLVQRMIDDGEIYQDGANRIALLAVNGVLYRAAIKATANRREVFLLTLFRTSEALANRQVRVLPRIQ